MRILFALMLVVVLAGGGWYGWHMSNPPTDTTAQTQADNFADNALNALYNASSTAATPAASTPNSATTTSSSTITATNTSQTITTNNKNYMHATLITDQGDITIEFSPDAAPNTVANFTKLAGSGFYNGVKFHRIIAGFMIQGGDPLTKDDSLTAQWGTGGPGYKFNDEIGANSLNNIGVVAMANSGPNTNGSQFFINTANNSFLNGKYTTFGKVISGMDVVTKIEHTPTDGSDRPLTPVVIKSVTLEQ